MRTEFDRKFVNNYNSTFYHCFPTPHLELVSTCSCTSTTTVLAHPTFRCGWTLQMATWNSEWAQACSTDLFSRWILYFLVLQWCFCVHAVKPHLYISPKIVHPEISKSFRSSIVVLARQKLVDYRICRSTPVYLVYLGISCLLVGRSQTTRGTIFQWWTARLKVSIVASH